MSGWRNVSIGYGLVITLLTTIIRSSTHAQSSVLAEGLWLKIAVTRTGLYKLDADFLNRYQFPISTLDPRTIRLFGNGGSPLPQRNDRTRVADLRENAIVVTGEADGRFDTEDAVYFFAQQPHPITLNSIDSRLTHQLNPYSDTTYYFLTVGSRPGKRVPTSGFTAPNAPIATYFDDYHFHELEETNRIHSGREWLGESFSLKSEQSFSFEVPGMLPNVPVWITSSVVSQATVPTQFQLRWGTKEIGVQSFLAIPVSAKPQYDLKGYENRQTFTVTPSLVDGPVQLTLSYRNAGQTNAQGYLNFLAIQARRELRQYNGQLLFRTLETAALPAVQYGIREVDTAAQVWDVTDPQQPIHLPVTFNDRREGVVAATGGKVREFLLFTSNQAYKPEAARRITNQNLRGKPTPDLVIVTAADWRLQAERLAEFRRQHDQLDVLVVTTQEIYNEFASGQPDPTAIRDAVRHWYDRTAGKLKYLLLFGDAVYDYKNHMQQLTPAQVASFVPVYESRESLHPIFSYSSDDYFGFLEPNEGEWLERRVGDYSGDHSLEIGIGRIPVKSEAEARTVVEKLIGYSSTGKWVGSWRTAITFIADDGDDNSHQADADRLAGQITALQPSFQIEKMYLDAYPQEFSLSGQKAPLVNQAINRAVNEGRLIINYNGHGGGSGWAEEQILTLQDIFSWKNNRLPLLVTATCEFGRYDEPALTSGAEVALLSRHGSIGLLTTTRPVYANANYVLNEAFYRSLGQAAGKLPLRLGDLMRQTKNTSLMGNLNRNFTLLGDPSMALGYPEAEVALTRIDGRVVDGKTDTLRALSLVQLEGEIRGKGGRLDNFDGEVTLTLYDKPANVTTRGTEGARMTYWDYRSRLFSGRASVRNGWFSCQFILPKDIDYTLGHGKLFAYAVRADGLLDATGSYENMIIGGSSPNPAVDTQPPTIRLAINDSTFSDGRTISGPKVTLLASLSDENGINIAQNGIGHELTARLNDGPPIVLNAYFTAEADQYKKGLVRYSWQDMNPGSYTLRLKAWDVYNNSSEATLTFVVSKPAGLVVNEVLVTPNPFREQTSLQVRHNRVGEELEAMLIIVDLNGRVIHEQTYRCLTCQDNWSEMSWNGLTLGGSLAPPGLYRYRLQLRSLTDGSIANSSGKLLYVR